MFFRDCATVDQVKTRYRDLARKHHPDLGGDTATMQQINAEYEIAMKRAIAGDPDSYRAEQATAGFEPLREAIEFAVTLPDSVDVIVRGFWLWLEGDTFNNRDQIKAFVSSRGKRFKFAPKKRAWFFAAVPSTNRGREFSMDEIEFKYGREEIKERRKRVAMPS
jgi:curved DNA-binding protein CbpA